MMDIVRLLKQPQETIIRELHVAAPNTLNFTVLWTLLKMCSVDPAWIPKIQMEFDAEHLTDRAEVRILRMFNFNKSIVSEGKWVIHGSELREWHELAIRSPLKDVYDNDPGYIPILLKCVVDEINAREFHAFISANNVIATATETLVNPEVATIIAGTLGENITNESEVRRSISMALMIISQKIVDLEGVVACMAEEGIDFMESDQQMELNCLRGQRALLKSVA